MGGHSLKATDIVVHPDRQKLASGDATGEIRIWRWLPFAGIIRWTEHPTDEAWRIGDCAKEFARAYIELAFPESRHPVSITKILGNDEYLDVMENAGLDRSKLELEPAT